MSPLLYNALLGMKFKIVSGYPGSNEVTLAIERGDDARLTQPEAAE